MFNDIFHIQNSFLESHRLAWPPWLVSSLEPWSSSVLAPADMTLWAPADSSPWELADMTPWEPGQEPADNSPWEPGDTNHDCQHQEKLVDLYLLTLFRWFLDWDIGAALLRNLLTLLTITTIASMTSMTSMTSWADLLVWCGALLLIRGLVHGAALLLVAGAALGLIAGLVAGAEQHKVTSFWVCAMCAFKPSLNCVSVTYFNTSNCNFWV